IRPVDGVHIQKIYSFLLEMVGYNNKLSPYYMPRTSVEEVDGKQILVIWCPAGINRPYSVPENVKSKSGSKEYFYIRSGTSSIIAKGEVLDELRELASRVPFDERGNSDITLEDISLVLLRDYLVKVGSRLADQVTATPLPKILDQMELYTGPKENRLIRNVAAMMFCENPNKFFPYTQIDVVTFPSGKLNDPNNFTEVTFKGSVVQMIKQTMDYIRSNILKEYVRKISGKQEADRFWNYPYDAIEEAVVNSVYHRDFQQHESIEITIEPSGISILNCPGPDRSILKEDIEKGDILKSRRYRNRRLGDFLKELDLTEGRSTGVPTIRAKLAENGSPRAVFETTDDRLTFLVTIPIHDGCNESSEKDVLDSEKSSEKTTTGSEKAVNSSEKILELIKQKPTMSAAEIAMEIDMTSRGVEKQIRKLREAGVIKRIGADRGGYWEIHL
ncbi:MAG: HTH domain-containing protein, partial [Bacteroidales bacterium]|nr:HTH domain-containing protein [Bacteroidales bacterium]